MFRDCQSGGYNLEATRLTGNRLIKIILLMTNSYSHDIIEGTFIKKNLQKYVNCRKQPEKIYRRRSTFGVRKGSQKWLNYVKKYAAPVEKLMKLTRNKRHFY